MRYSISAYGMTDQGRRRERNEDAWLVHALGIRNSPARQTGEAPCGVLLAVADGMGGHDAGDVASQLAVATLKQCLAENLSWQPKSWSPEAEQSVLSKLQQAARFCHKTLQQEADEAQHRRMGATLTAAYVQDDRLVLVNVGDSRCYLWRAGSLLQLTHDHTFAQRFVDEEGADMETMANTRFNHMLWNSLGASRGSIYPDPAMADLQPGDRILLCSDGLNAHVPDHLIEAHLNSNDTPQQVCRRVIEAANAGGGKDNITVIVADIAERRKTTATEAVSVYRHLPRCDAEPEYGLADGSSLMC